jgi:hypothetical protein
MVAVLCARVLSRLFGAAFSQMFAPCSVSALRGPLRAAIAGFAHGAALSSPRSCERCCATYPDGFRLSVPRLLLSWSYGLWMCFAAVSGPVSSQPVFWLFWIFRHLPWQVAPLPSMLCIHRCPAVDLLGSGVVGSLVLVSAVFLLSAVLCSLLCLVAPLPLMLCIYRCPMIEIMVRLIVSARSSFGMRWFGCCGPCDGSVWLRVGVLLSGGSAVV